MKKYKNFIPVIFLGIIVLLVVFRIEPPNALSLTNFLPMMIFITALFLFLLFLVNLFFRFLIWSAVLSFGLIFLLILQTLNFLNPITFILTFIVVIVLLKTIKRPREFSLRKLSYQSKIPKISKLKRQR